MHKDTRRLDLKPLGLALKRARIAKNMTQEAVGQMVDRTSRTIMHIENKGQHPSLNVFYQLVTYFDIPVDQYFFPESESDKDCRQRIGVLLGTLNDNELAMIEAMITTLKANRKPVAEKE